MSSCQADFQRGVGCGRSRVFVGGLKSIRWSAEQTEPSGPLLPSSTWRGYEALLTVDGHNIALSE
eukprot:926467-Amphidinium_carterae.1